MKQDVINENSHAVVTLSFTDEKGVAVVPTAGQYRLDDVASETELLAWTAFTPSAATHDLIITDVQNAIMNNALEAEKKRLTIDFTFGSDNKKATAEYIYVVRNLSKIP